MDTHDVFYHPIRAVHSQTGAHQHSTFLVVKLGPAYDLIGPILNA
jgi:hypothetical protein